MLSRMATPWPFNMHNVFTVPLSSTGKSASRSQSLHKHQKFILIADASELNVVAQLTSIFPSLLASTLLKKEFLSILWQNFPQSLHNIRRTMHSFAMTTWQWCSHAKRMLSQPQCIVVASFEVVIASERSSSWEKEGHRRTVYRGYMPPQRVPPQRVPPQREYHLGESITVYCVALQKPKV